MRTIGHVIGGKAVDSDSGRTSPVFNPATGEQTAAVGLASGREVDDAVDAARSALAEWSRVSLARRAEILFAFREQLHRRADDLAAVITAEHGKVHSDALGEIARGLENVEFACGIPHLLKGGFSEQVATDIDVHEVHQPVGVVVGITPFNFPVMVPLWMAASAIACGNTFVLKPSEKDPSAALLLAELWAEAGLPPGVFNVLNGDRSTVERLIDHPDVAAVSFVGSTPIARAVYTRGTAAGKRVQALGGAKNHLIVLPDADVDMAADAVVSAAYGSAGERCMAVSVVVAVGGVGDVLVEAVETRMAALRVGPGDDPSSQMGPLVTREHRDRVASYLDIAAAEGATVRVDGRTGADDGGFFLNPSLVDDVQPGMQVYRDEIFGPVLSVVRVDTYAEALDVVNGNRYGNGTAIFTRDGGIARRFASDVNVGMVGVNVPVPVPVAAFSFGGWKDSLFGDTHIYGPESIHFYTRTKVVTTRWPDPATSTVDLGFPRNR
jgi:malonate-semialdehyde dehydrogenase (acetylating)/methylmalonate-semialdehyde dehydrogenase